MRVRQVLSGPPRHRSTHRSTTSAIADPTQQSLVDRRTSRAAIPERSTELVCTASLKELTRMIRTRKSRLAGFIAALALLLTTGCVVGPRFKKPAAPDVSGYTPAPISTTSSTGNVAGGEAQHMVDGHDISGEWWTLFHSKPLDDLIERSLKANPDLKAAQAALLVARENVVPDPGA